MPFSIGSAVQIINHSEPNCNGQYGTIEKIEVAYDGYTRYYSVRLEDSDQLCVCTDDEVMEA